MDPQNGKKGLLKENDRNREFLRTVKFTLFSVSAGLIQLASAALFKEVLGWPSWLSYLLSLILSVLWNFTVNRRYTFRSDADLKRSMLLVAVFYVIFTPMSTWWVAALTGENPFTGAAASETPLMNYWVVQLGTMLVNFVLEFLWQRFVVYRGSIDTNASAKRRRE